MNIQSSFCSSLEPHIRIKINSWIYYSISSHINIQALFLHLCSELSRYFRRFRGIVICLNFSCELKFVLGSILISLRESIMVNYLSCCMSISSKKRFYFTRSNNFNNLYSLFDHFICFVFLNDNRFYLVIINRFLKLLILLLVIIFNVILMWHWSRLAWLRFLRRTRRKLNFLL